MNCQTFENIIDDLAREQLIETNARQEALRHTEECSACAVRLVDERAITVGLRALAEDMQAVEAPAQIQAELLAAFQHRQVVQLAPRARRWTYLAAAAVLLMGVAIGLAAWNWNSNGVQRAENPVPTLIRPGETQPSGLPVTANGGGSKGKLETAPSEVTVSAGTYRRTGNARRRNARQTTSVGAANNLDNSAANVEVATDFMPIGYVNSQSLQDGGSVVRVELSRSTIVSMGFAVNMDRYGERVKADVLMGADGLARAIRFVQ
jgi:hypothetical protein